ncbi:hypothetical protein GYMLUDRAFT_246223 [Collybiopsis luxurians FD-317 M1]|uniref:Uncharacterized protein n=1 Tax=Collybiopsis luxurians FD-317 M1 TaxID=944289 RepID=A0A0D0C6P2_9AGAR|nr:hypothetical protein GYMLUDRAFT_246223 [Collybiopsis luxurians FD-317 M1]
MSSSVSATRQSFENPKSRFHFAPDVGTYISFSLDVKQSLDLLRCDVHEEFEEAIRNFPVRNYVAIVQDYPSSLPIPDVPYQCTTIRLLQQGLPEPIPEFCLEPHMCYPVVPEMSHPLNRPPIRTNMPLPWEGCYHLSCLDAEVCIPQSHFDYANATSMDDNDWLRSYRYCREDAVARANRKKSQSGETTDTPIQPNDEPAQELVQESSSESFESEADDECSSPPAPHPPSQRLDPTKYKFYEDGTIDWYATEFGDEPNGEVYAEVDEESVDDLDACSESIRWLSDDEDGFQDEDEGPEDVDERIPSMNAMFEALKPFDGYMPDGSIVPVINFTPDLSGIPSLFSAEQFYRDFKAAKALLKQCVEDPPVPTLIVIEETRKETSSTAREGCVPEAAQESVQRTIRRPISAFRKRIEKVGDALKMSRIGKLFKRVLCRSNTKN